MESPLKRKQPRTPRSHRSVGQLEHLPKVPVPPTMVGEVAQHGQGRSALGPQASTSSCPRLPETVQRSPRPAGGDPGVGLSYPEPVVAPLAVRQRSPRIREFSGAAVAPGLPQPPQPPPSRSFSPQPGLHCATGAPLAPLGVSQEQLNQSSASGTAFPEEHSAASAAVQSKSAAAARQLQALHAKLGLGSLMPAAEAVVVVSRERAATPQPEEPAPSSPTSDAASGWAAPVVLDMERLATDADSKQGSRAATPTSRRPSKVSAAAAFAMVGGPSGGQAMLDMRSLLGELDGCRKLESEAASAERPK